MSHNPNIIEALNTLGIKHCCYNCAHRFCIDEEDGNYWCRIEKEDFFKQSDYENNDCLDFELNTGDLEIEELKQDDR